MVARLFCYTKPKKMKKIITTTVCLLATIGMAAQGEQHVFPGDYFYFSATHPEFSVDGISQLYSSSHSGESERTYTFYDDNFVKLGEWTAQNAISGKIYRQEFTPEVTGVEFNAWQEGEDYKSIEHNSEGTSTYYDYATGETVYASGPLTIEGARNYVINLFKIYEEDAEDVEILKEETTADGTFFYYRYLGNNQNYPESWFWLTTNGSLIYVHRKYSYEITPIVSGNYIPGEREEVSEGYSVGPYQLSFYDFDSPSYEDRYLRVTQTLFNDDDKYEYLRPLYSDGLSSIHMFNSWVSIDDTEFYLPYIVKEYGGRCSGFQVVNEDGSVLQTVNFDGSFVGGGSSEDTDLIRIHGKLYLVFSGYVLNEANNTMSEATLVYALDRKSNQIQKVGEHIGNLNVYPRVADRSDQITVELNDNGDIREIQVVNANGQTEVRIPVKEGQKSITIPANQLGRGMNVVNAVGRKGHQSHKVVVR